MAKVQLNGPYTGFDLIADIIIGVFLLLNLIQALHVLRKKKTAFLFSAFAANGILLTFDGLMLAYFCFTGSVGEYASVLPIMVYALINMLPFPLACRQKDWQL